MCPRDINGDSQPQHTLEIEDFHLYFETFKGTAEVVEGIDLAIDKSETVALVGESGCGKSSIAHSILGILPPQARIVRGKINFEGRNILTMNEKERSLWLGRKITYVPQYPMTSLSHAFKVKEQMSDMIKYAGMIKAPVSGYFFGGLRRHQNEDLDARKKAIEMLGKVDIPSPEHVMESYPFQLSGGMRQRVLIAMALTVNPILLIADEPGSALDVTIQDKINRLVKDIIKEEGLSLLYVTHDLAVARMISQRIYVMYAGCIVETGKTEEIYNSPRHPYTIGLMEALPKITGVKFRGIDGRIPDYFNPPKGCRFYQRCNYAKKICEERRPELRRENGHWVACHS
jgi:peptide/nickel transport system ATP-binding protein